MAAMDKTDSWLAQFLSTEPPSVVVVYDWSERMDQDTESGTTKEAKRAERLHAVEAHLRTVWQAEGVERALGYLRGELALDEWRENGRNLHWKVIGDLGVLFASTPSRLDDIDVRLLDICVASGDLSTAIHRLGANLVVYEACDYAISQGIEPGTIYKSCCRAGRWWLDKDDQPTPVGRWMLDHLPDHFVELRALMMDGLPNDLSRRYAYKDFIPLLLAGSPPRHEFALEVAQQAPAELLGDLTVLLLDDDYERYIEWGRYVAGPESPGTQEDREGVLRWLMQRDPAQYEAMALEAFHTPHERGKHPFGPHLQVTALSALYSYDPNRYFPLLEIACASKDERLCEVAIAIVTHRFSFEQALPLLQKCVASGHTQVASQVLRRPVLAEEWDGRDAYALSLLGHSSKKVRDTVIWWLAHEGRTQPEALAPTLAGKKIEARLAAIKVLGNIGGEQSRGLLRAHLAVEQDERVQQAIIDIVGTPDREAQNDDDLRSRIAAFIAEAEAAMAGIEVPERTIWEDLREGAPMFYWRTGEPITTSILFYLLYEQLRGKSMQPVASVMRAQALVDRERSGEAALLLASRIRYAASMYNKRPNELFPLTAAMALGDDRLVAPTNKDIWHYRSGDHASRRFRMQLVEALGALGSDAALQAVYNIAVTHRSRATVRAADDTLDMVSKQRGITTPTLLDMIAPRLGMDEYGRRVFDYGSRQFTACFGADGELRLVDDGGSKIATLPEPSASDDAAKATLAREQWQAFQTDVANEFTRQTKRLYEEYRTPGNRYAADWTQYLLGHPLLRVFAINNIWVFFLPGAENTANAFRATDDGVLVDRDDNPVEPPPESLVQRAWQHHMTTGERDAWVRYRFDHGMKSPVSQF